MRTCENPILNIKIIFVYFDIGIPFSEYKTKYKAHCGLARFAFKSTKHKACQLYQYKSLDVFQLWKVWPFCISSQPEHLNICVQILTFKWKIVDRSICGDNWFFSEGWLINHMFTDAILQWKSKLWESQNLGIQALSTDTAFVLPTSSPESLSPTSYII